MDALFSLSHVPLFPTHINQAKLILTAPIVLFQDPLETIALIPHRIKSQSV